MITVLYFLFPQILMSVRQKRLPVLTAATTRWAPSPVFVTPPMSWDRTENSATVSLNLPDTITSTDILLLQYILIRSSTHTLHCEPLKGIEMEIVNSCENNNGGCSHHCQHSNSGPVCACNHGYRLDDDLKTCVGKPACLIFKPLMLV